VQKSLVRKILEVSRWKTPRSLTTSVRSGRPEALEMLLDLIETRFGKVPNELRSRLEALKSHEEIKQAMRKAISVETIEEYLAKLEH